MACTKCEAEQNIELITDTEYQRILLARLNPPPVSLSVMSVIQRPPQTFSLWTCRFTLRSQAGSVFNQSPEEIFTGRITGTFTFRGPNLLADTDERRTLLSGNEQSIDAPATAGTLFNGLRVGLKFNRTSGEGGSERYSVTLSAKLGEQLIASSSQLRSLVVPASTQPGTPTGPGKIESFLDWRCCKKKTIAGQVLEVCESRPCQTTADGKKDCAPDWTVEPYDCANCGDCRQH